MVPTHSKRLFLKTENLLIYSVVSTLTREHLLSCPKNQNLLFKPVAAGFFTWSNLREKSNLFYDANTKHQINFNLDCFTVLHYEKCKPYFIAILRT